MGYKFEKYSIGGGGNASLPPNQLHEGSTAEEIMAAFDEYLETGKVMIWTDVTNYETCFWVTFLDDPVTLYFMKGSTKQLIAVAIGDTVSWSYIDLAGAGGSGGSGGGGIIDVTALPTENIDEQSIYRVTSGGAEMYLVMEADGTLQALTLSELWGGANVTITLVETTPTSVPLSDESTMTIYVYVVASGDDAGYGYLDMGSGVMTLGALMGDAEGNKGFSEDINAETETGFYAVLVEATYTFHAYKDGTWVELVDRNYADKKGVGWNGSGYAAEKFNDGINQASGDYSHAEGGGGTTASGDYSHAEGGGGTTASGDYSHAEGNGTTASATAAHAEGYDTIASGWASHAEGNDTTAIGNFTHAEGTGTIARSDDGAVFPQHVQGKFNIEDTEQKYAHIVGNGGNIASRSNAHTLDWDGNAWFAGTVEGTALILASSTEGSTKRFKITVDDSGTLTATEITT